MFIVGVSSQASDLCQISGGWDECLCHLVREKNYNYKQNVKSMTCTER